MKYPVDEELILHYELVFRELLSACKNLNVIVPEKVTKLRERVLESWQKHQKN